MIDVNLYDSGKRAEISPVMSNVRVGLGLRMEATLIILGLLTKTGFAGHFLGLVRVRWGSWK